MSALLTTPGTITDVESYTRGLHDFLDALPHHLKGGRLEELHHRCSELLRTVPEASADEHLHPAFSRTQALLADLQAALKAKKPQAYVLVRYEELSRSYEHWLISVRKKARALGAPAPAETGARLRPLIKARTAFHVSMGVLASSLYQLILTRWQAVAILFTLLTIFGSLEISRRIAPRFNDVLLKSPIFKPIARPDEYYRINSATYYLLALCIVTPIFSRPAVLVGILILAFADPAAAWVGKRYGKTKLYQRKSVAGTLTFFSTGLAVSAGLLFACYPELSIATRLGAAVLASAVAAVAELFSTGVDDNFTVPIAAVLAAAVVL
jgi:dolichol kinase